MNAYRQQQLAAAALIDSGDYTADQVAEVFGWIKPNHKPPERAAPERSGTTGHNQTLTPRRKCGIIKAIKRYLHRYKKKQEEKKMATIKIFWAETNANEGILLTDGKRWYYQFGGKIDDITVTRENAGKIAANIRAGLESGGFDATDFNDWCNSAEMRSNPPHYSISGYGDIANDFETIRKL